MKKIYMVNTEGYCTQEKLYWDFIKSMNLDKEYKLWHTAIVEKSIEVHD